MSEYFGKHTRLWVYLYQKYDTNITPKSVLNPLSEIAVATSFKDCAG